MASAVSIRRVTPDDLPHIEGIASRSMTASYTLSPGEIEAICSAEFDRSAVETKRRDDNVLLLVAVAEGTVAGFVEGVLGAGRVRWLHVDPDHRGRGVGTALFEACVSQVAESADGPVEAAVLAADEEGGGFFERFDFELVEERPTTVAGRELVEQVYAASGTDRSVDRTAEVPESVTDDGRTVYPGEERVAGTEGAFTPTYADDARSEPYGYVCGHCGSTEVSVDSMDRLECGECGNVAKPDDSYDGAYL